MYKHYRYILFPKQTLKRIKAFNQFVLHSPNQFFKRTVSYLTTLFI